MKILLYFLIISGFLHAQDQFPSVEKASFYHNHSQQQWQVAFEALKKIDWEGNEQILDIGCGNGKITANIAGRVPEGKVLGLDISHGMVAFAKKTYTPFYENLTFTQEDILYFTSDTPFDLIFSASSLHWILDHHALLAKVHSLLKEQGTLLFTIPCASAPDVAKVFRDVQEQWKEYLTEYYHPRRKFTADEYVAILKEEGFDQIEIAEVPFTYHFDTKRELADWYAAFSPMLFYIPEEKHAEFLASVVERYLQTFPLDGSGRVVFKQNELVIKALKQKASCASPLC